MACRTAIICLVLASTSCIARRTNIDDSSALEVFTGGGAVVAQGSTLNSSNSDEGPPMLAWGKKAAEKAALAASAFGNPKSTQWWKSVETETRQMANDGRIEDMAGKILEMLADVKDTGERKSHIAFALGQVDISSKSTPTLEQLTNRLLFAVEQWCITKEKDKHYLKSLSSDALQHAVNRLGVQFRVSDASVCKQAAFFLMMFEKLLPTIQQSQILQQSLNIQHLVQAARDWVDTIDANNLGAWYTQSNGFVQVAKELKMRGEFNKALEPLSRLNAFYQAAERILDKAKEWIGEKLKEVLLDNSFVSVKKEGFATLTRQNLPHLPGRLEELPLNFEAEIISFCKESLPDDFSNCILRPEVFQRLVHLALMLGYKPESEKFEDTRALLRQAWLGKLQGVGQPVKQDEEGELKNRLQELKEIAEKLQRELAKLKKIAEELPAELQAKLTKLEKGEMVGKKELARIKDQLIDIIIKIVEKLWEDEDEKKAAALAEKKAVVA